MPAQESNTAEGAMPRWLTLAVAAAVVFVLVGGIAFYRDTERSLRRQAEDEISAIGLLKVEQVHTWRTERLRNARRIAEAGVVPQRLARYLESPSPETLEPLTQVMRAIRIDGDYDEVIVVDARGTVVASLSGRDPTLDSHGRDAYQAVIARRQPLITDPHQDPDGPGTLHITVAAPLHLSPDASAPPVGAVLMLKDPNESLFQLVGEWPTPTESAESLLVKRDGDDALFLSDLRHVDNAALTLRIPVTRTEVPAVRAVLGEEGLFEGDDYRSVPVLAYVAPIPDSDWHLVAKVDVTEAFAEWRTRGPLIAALTLALAVLLGGAVVIAWQRAGAAQLHRLIRSQREREWLLDVIGRSANEIYVFDAETLRFTFANASALANVGYTLDELKRLTPLDLKPAFDRDSFAMLVGPLASGTRTLQVFETFHRRKDGSEYPVEIKLQRMTSATGDVFLAVIGDITERLAAEARLHELDEVVSRSPAVAFTWANEPGWPIEFVSRSVGRFGYDADELIAARTPHTELMHPDDVPRIEREVEDSLASGLDEFDEEYRVVTADGDVRWVAEHTWADQAGGGDVPRLQGVLVDITARRRAEQQLAESEARFRYLADNGRGLIWTSGVDTLCDYFNKPWLAFTGRTLEQELGEGWVEGVHPDDFERCVRTYTEAFGRREGFSMVYRLRHASGEYRWIVDDGVPRYDAAGEFIGYVGHCLDINDLYEAESALRESEERFRLVSSAMMDIAYSCRRQPDGQCRIAWMTGAAETTVGYTIDEVKAMGCWGALVIEQDAAVLRKNFLELTPGRSAECELRVRRKDGGVVWLASYARCIALEDGTGADMVYGALIDITERKLAEAEVRRVNESLEHLVDERTEELAAANEELQSTAEDLAAANEELTEANEAKGRFLRSMSHELRTPLNSIIGFSDLIMTGLAGETTEEQLRQLAMINHSGKHLLALINDILDLSRIEAGKVELKIERFDTRALAESALESVAPQAEDKGLSLTLDAPAEPLEIDSDATRVRQVLLNLLGNAVKFTDAGSVTLRVSRAAPGMVALSVTDTGPGIPKADHERIFGEFTQRIVRETGPSEGTGLGLAISRGLAALLGGAVTVESRLGTGSTFTLMLPVGDSDTQDD